MRRTLLFALILVSAAAGCGKRAPAGPPAPQPGPGQVAVRVTNQSGGRAVVWLDAGRMHHWLGDTPPNTTTVHVFEKTFFEDSVAVLRAYPLPFVCHFNQRIARSGPDVVDMLIPSELSWPSAVTERDDVAMPEQGICRREDKDMVVPKSGKAGTD